MAQYISHRPCIFGGFAHLRSVSQRVSRIDCGKIMEGVADTLICVPSIKKEKWQGQPAIGTGMLSTSINNDHEVLLCKQSIAFCCYCSGNIRMTQAGGAKRERKKHSVKIMTSQRATPGRDPMARLFSL